MIALTIKLDQVSCDNILRKVATMPATLRDRILKHTMRMILQLMQETARGVVRKDLGILADSIDFKISSKGSRGEAVYGVVGPRSGIKVQVGIISRGPHKGAPYMLIPTRYAHLIEYGHRLVAPGSGRVVGYLQRLAKKLNPTLPAGTVVGTVPPYPFMRAAWDAWGGEPAVALFVDELTDEVDAWAHP